MKYEILAAPCRRKTRTMRYPAIGPGIESAILLLIGFWFTRLMMIF